MAHAARVDPRVSIAIDLGARGPAAHRPGAIYHQAPSPQYFDDVRGAVTLSR